jgi:hypothetical protein
MTKLRVSVLSLLALLIAAYAGQGKQEEPHDSLATIYLRGVPKSASVTINDNPFRLIKTKPITFPPGMIQLRVSSGTTQMVKSFSLKAGESKVLNFNGNINYSLVDVITDPLKAEVYIDGKKAGETPFVDSLVQPGAHTIAIKKYGYDPVTREVNLVPQEELELAFDLNQSKAWVDSVAKAKTVHRQKRRFVQRVVYTVLGATCAGAAVYFEFAARQNIKNADYSASTYDGAETGFDDLRTQYYDNRSAAKENIRRRDIAAAVSGGIALGFAFTFVF